MVLVHCLFMFLSTHIHCLVFFCSKKLVQVNPIICLFLLFIQLNSWSIECVTCSCCSLGKVNSWRVDVGFFWTIWEFPPLGITLNCGVSLKEFKLQRLHLFLLCFYNFKLGNVLPVKSSSRPQQTPHQHLRGWTDNWLQCSFGQINPKGGRVTWAAISQASSVECLPQSRSVIKTVWRTNCYMLLFIYCLLFRCFLNKTDSDPFSQRHCG